MFQFTMILGATNTQNYDSTSLKVRQLSLLPCDSILIESSVTIFVNTNYVKKLSSVPAYTGYRQLVVMLVETDPMSCTEVHMANKSWEITR